MALTLVIHSLLYQHFSVVEELLISVICYNFLTKDCHNFRNAEHSDFYKILQAKYEFRAYGPVPPKASIYVK